MRRFKLYMLLTLLALLLLFTIQNAAAVQLDFLFWSFQMRRSLLVIFLLVIGAGVGWILCGAVGRRRLARRDQSQAKA